MSEQQRKVVIIGGGPAGLTAALYAARATLEPLVLEGQTQPGGQLTTTTEVENFPGFEHGIEGPALIDIMRKQVTRFGAEIRAEAVQSVDLSRRPFRLRTSAGEVLAETLIIATGATARYLGLPSEQAFLGRGVSACATCDGFFFRGQQVVVVGGGDTALEEAQFLTRFASRVYLVHRRDTLRASRIMQDRARANPKIEFVWNTVVDEIVGDEKGVTGVRLRNVVTGETRVQDAHGYFVAIGHEPNTALFRDWLDLDANGYLVKQPETSHTRVPGVFVAGDVHDPRYRQAITAAGAGCKAAIDAERFLEETAHAAAH